MKISDLQARVIGSMGLASMSLTEIKTAIGHAGSHVAFRGALRRMLDSGLLDRSYTSPPSYVTTPKGLGAFVDHVNDNRDSTMTVTKIAAHTDVSLNHV